MAIIIDMNQVMISNLMKQIGNHTNSKIEENMIRHMILNSLRSYKVKFSNEYGDIIIACDGSNCWRKEVYPYYKANRKKIREKTEVDWKSIFEFMNKIVNEIRDNFPYKVMHIERVEADDIIASVIKHIRITKESNEKILILSADKDFIQLHTYENVNQYDPVRKKWISSENPKRYLLEHILKGDSGDGVPNIISSDNCFVIGQRQLPMTKKKIDYFLNTDLNKYDNIHLKNYERNKKLIDLNEIPNEIYEKIISDYIQEKIKDRKSLINYFMKNKLNNLIEHISEF